MRRLLTLIAILGAAAPVVLFAVQDDDAEPPLRPQRTNTKQRKSACPRRGPSCSRESRELAVALAIEPGMPLRLTATIISGQGAGVDGLDVELIAGTAASGASNRGRT